MYLDYSVTDVPGLYPAPSPMCSHLSSFRVKNE